MNAKYWYVSEVYESQEAEALADGYFAVLLEEDAEAMRKRISDLLHEVDVLNDTIEHNLRRTVKMEKALRNCLLLAMRELHAHKNHEYWKAIVRFCEEGGVEPSPLRGL